MALGTRNQIPRGLKTSYSSAIFAIWTDKAGSEQEQIPGCLGWQQHEPPVCQERADRPTAFLESSAGFKRRCATT